MSLASLARPRPPRTRVPGLAVAVALHAALGALLYHGHQAASLARSTSVPIMVSFITPEPVVPPKPQPPQPVVEPKPAPKQAVKPKPKPAEKPVIASKSPEPAPYAAPEPEPEPEPVAEQAPPPAPPAAPAPAVADAPVQTAPPRFNADYLQNPKPPYPNLSRRLQEEGTVVLRVYVSPNGLPEQVEVSKSSGYARLDESALNTVRKYWKFVPARRGDTPVGGWVLVPIAFTLEG